MHHAEVERPRDKWNPRRRLGGVRRRYRRLRRESAVASIVLPRDEFEATGAAAGRAANSTGLAGATEAVLRRINPSRCRSVLCAFFGLPRVHRLLGGFRTSGDRLTWVRPPLATGLVSGPDCRFCDACRAPKRRAGPKQFSWKRCLSEVFPGISFVLVSGKLAITVFSSTVEKVASRRP